MRPKFTLVFVLILLGFSFSNAQDCDPTSPPDEAAAGCACAYPDCDVGLSGFSGTLGDPNGFVTPIPECTDGAGGTFHNDDWIAFIAGSTSISITITPSNCNTVGGLTGVQAGFYGNCDASASAEGIPSDGLLVQCSCSSSALTLDYDAFVCGQTYYIFLDGCGGSVCDYDIVVNSGSTTLNPPGPLGSITGPTDVCPGQTVTYTIDEVFCVPDYDWTVTGGGVIVSEDGATCTVTWNSGGSISTFGENACFMTNISPPLNVNVTPLADLFAEGNYCDNEPGFLFPPGSGGTLYTAGVWTITETLTSGPNIGCTQNTILTVTTTPTYNQVVDRVICFGDQVTYGGLPYMMGGSYDIPLQTTTYLCDSNITLNLTVLDPLSFINLTPPLDQITCTNTSVIVDGSQSFPAQDIQQYLWTTFDGDICGGQGSPVMTACAPGNYCLEVSYSQFDPTTGVNVSCSDQSCIEITENIDAPSLSIVGTDLSCGGAGDGSATVTITGGQPDFLIAWNDVNNSTTETVEDLPAGTYTVAVFSLTNGCTAQETITILEPDAIQLDMSSVDALCNGGNDGTASVVASGGSPDYTYEWNTTPVQVGTTATGLAAGTYTVIVTDANDCTSENTVDVGQAMPMSVTIDGVDILCNGENTGTATANGLGGSGVYTYSWNTSPEQVDQTAINLTANSYTVIITDENGCTATESITLNEEAVLELETSSTDASCGGNNDGSASVIATGGAGSYEYEWNTNPVQNGSTASNIPTGNYTVLVTDDNGCTQEAMVSVNEPAGVMVTTDFMDAQCNGASDGEASVSTSGGTPPFDFTWSTVPVQNGPTANDLAAGSYTVTVEDANGCQVIEVVDVGEPSAVNLVETGVDVLCNGASSGEASVVASGGTPPYDYQWDDNSNQTTATATGLGAGTYAVIVTDANDCTETVSVIVDEPTEISLVEGGTDALCFESEDGEVTVTATGGVAPYEYLWDDNSNQTTATATGLGAGTYAVIVTDANDCTETVSVTILEPTVLEVSTNGTNPDCNNSTEGVASVNANGGTPPYEYLWDDNSNQTTASATNLGAGTYTVIVTDANDCTATESIVLNAPNAIVLDTDQVNILCTTETTGEATVNAVGGTPPLSYLWDDDASQNTATATGLGANTYNVIVTDNNGCSETISVTILEPAEVLEVSGTSTEALCGSANGTIDLTVTGGTSPYDYDWNGAAGNEQDPNNLNAGTYTVVVTDANGCTANTTVTVTSPNSPAAAVVITDVNCNGESNGIMDITVSGGIAPYSFAWDPANNGDEDLIDIVAGSYSVTVTDQAGCSVVANGVIAEPDLLEATATGSPADCGIDNGSISVVVSGGIGDYTYDWPGTANDGTQSPSGLAAGPYEVTVTDENGCSVIAATEVIVPNGPMTSLTNTEVGCNGESTGTISLTITGGAGPYGIDWGDPVLDGNENLTSLAAGVYQVIVTDANNCSSVSSVEIIEPPVLSVVTSSTALTCAGSNDGTATATVTGGTGPYTFIWCDGQSGQTANNCIPGPCTVIVTDANGCSLEETVIINEPAPVEVSVDPVDADCNAANTGSIEVSATGGTGIYTYTWTNGIPANTEDPASLGAGSYDLIVTDENGCTAEATSIVINEPDAISLSFTSTNATCNMNNGTIDLSVMGGTAPYSYSWTGGLPGDQDPIDVGTGSYDVVVTDNNGCTEMGSVSVNTPDALSIISTAFAADCNGSSTGSIEVDIIGGTAPFTYQWDDAALQITEDAVSLPAGTYNLVVTDGNGCTITTSELVTEPEVLALSSTSVSPLCFGSSDGTIDLVVTGGTMPYTYQWDDAATQVIEDPVGLLAGNYNVIVTDANGCTAELSQDVDMPTEITTSTATTDALCNGAADGTIDLTVNGGTAPYEYVWDDANGQIIEDPAGLTAGNYSVTITDDNGCTSVTSSIIGEPIVLAVSGVTNEATCGEANGSIDLTVTGGTMPYTYDWNGTLPNEEDPAAVLSGNYDVIVTDANGCTASTSVNVSEPAALTISSTPSSALCNNETSGSIDLIVGGGTLPYTYQWDDAGSQTIEDPISLLAGTYNVIVTDANGCTIEASATIDEPTALQANETTTIATCGESNGTIDLTVTGGTAPYTFDWSGTLPNEEDPQNVMSGTYNVTITDSNGCTLESSATVSTPNMLEGSAVPADALCNGEASGAIDLIITGGTAPYDVIWSGGLGTNEDPIDVLAGDYTVIVTDGDGCQILVSASVGQPDVITLFAVSDQATCNQANGSIDLTVIGGTAPYTYQWDDVSGQTVEDPVGIAAGSYNVTVTDNNNCTATFSSDVSTPSALLSDATSVDALCAGDANGSVDLTVSGGTLPYTYSWSNSETTEDLSGVGEGTYTVTITDGVGCTITASALVDEPEILLAENTSPTNVSCNGGNDGSATIVVTGGTPGYNYDWSDNAFDGQDAPSNMSSGMYSVTVTDGNGCTVVVDLSIIEPSAMTLSTSSSPTACFGSLDGSIGLDVAGGTGPYTFDWNNGMFTDEDPQGVGAGNYTVIVTDDNGCTETASIQVAQPSAVLVNIDNVSNYGGMNVTCSDATDGSAEAFGIGGNEPYSFEWSTGAQSSAVENLAAGVYTVTLTDGNGCTNETNVELVAPSAVNVDLEITDPDCYGENDGVIVAEGSGGTGPYMYALDSDTYSSSNQFGGLVSGDYTVGIIDANGCEQALGASVIDPTELIVDLGDDIEIQMGDSIFLDPIVNIGQFALDTFMWRRSELIDFKPFIGPLETSTYQLTVVNGNGCVDEDQIVVRVRKDRLIYIPNIFTPNEDGNNDYFMIYGGQGVKEVKTFRIFNRWGEILHEKYSFPPVESNTVDFGWDGKFRGEVLNPAVFVYFAEIEFIDGRVEIYKGDVTLMR